MEQTMINERIFINV